MEGEDGEKGWERGKGGEGKKEQEGRLAIPILVCFRRRCRPTDTECTLDVMTWYACVCLVRRVTPGNSECI